MLKNEKKHQIIGEKAFIKTNFLQENSATQL